VISQLSEIFPARYAHLGWEVPYLAIIRPIPRAIWKGKPEGMSLTMEEALQVEGLTLASTFIGEAYIAFGYPGIVAFGLLFGMFAGWWSHLASPRNSDFGILIYASGFFAVVISMRSLFVFTTAILPTLVTIIGGSLLIEKARRLPRKSRS
jgi:oligosaccharide repeat unit polymerase